MKTFEQLNKHLGEKFGNFAGKVKKALPLALFAIPGGAGMGMWYLNAEHQAKMINEMNQAIADAEAQQSFIDRVNGMNFQDYMTAQDNAHEIASEAYSNAALNNSGNPMDAYNQVYQEEMAKGLNVTNQEYGLLVDICQDKFNSQGLPVCPTPEMEMELLQSWGFESKEEIFEFVTPLWEKAQQGDQNALNTLDLFNERLVNDMCNITIGEVAEEVPAVAEQNITGVIDEVSANMIMSSSMEEAIAIAAATAGAALVGYGLSVRQARKSFEAKNAREKEQDKGMEL